MDYAALARIGAEATRNGAPVSGPALAVLALRQAIVTGLLEGGAPIRQDLVADALSISKIPVREALRELEAERLVQFTPNRGFAVAPESMAELREAYELRTALESLALKHSIGSFGPKHARHARSVLQLMDRDPDLTRHHRWNLEFHLSLYAPCARPYLLTLIRQAHSVSHRYGYATLRHRGLPAPDNTEHRALLDACQRQDGELALRLLAHHLDSAADRVTASYQDLLETRAQGASK